MRASIFDIPSADECGEATDGVDAVVASLQRCGASEVDKGLMQLLQALLAMTHARHVNCSLVDISPCHGRTVILTESAGLCSVDGAAASCAGMIPCEFVVRPGRHLLLEFSPGRPDGSIHVGAVMGCLHALPRWLAWLDLSYGPVTDKGPMPAHHRKVLLALLKGRSEKQVAADLGLSINTTHQYVTALYRRFNVRNRASLMGMWLASA